MQWLARTPSIDLLGAILLMVLWAGFVQPWLGARYSLAVVIGITLLVTLVWWQWPSQWAAAAYLTRWGRLQVLRFNVANQITLGRALLVIMVLAAIAVPNLAQQWVWFLLAMSVLALILDGVDGWVARRWHLQSSYGARFDMEVDAAFMLGLCVLLVMLERAGWWVLWIGALRYLFWGAGLIWSFLQQPLPPSQLRRWVCGWQIVILILVIPGVLPAVLNQGLLFSALLLLLYSFARDIGWLFKERIHV